MGRYVATAQAPAATRASPHTLALRRRPGRLPWRPSRDEFRGYMEFIDFEIRAWQADDEHVAVLVHSSPLGEMRKPSMVACNVAALRPMVTSFRDKLEARGSPETARAETVSLGRALSDMLLPRAVHALLRRSIERVSRDAGVRLRLCLDESERANGQGSGRRVFGALLKRRTAAAGEWLPCAPIPAGL